MNSNLFKNILLPLAEKETFEELLRSDTLRVERIISNGQTTPSDQWYDSEKNEWVVLLQGKASLEIENQGIVHLSKGDYLNIPAHQRHKVTYTSKQPHCVWLAIHY